MYLFFFSSRRRHTRFDCDWSSDVCSSDLDVLAITFIFGGGTLFLLAISPVGKAVAERIRRHGGAALPEDVRAQLDALRSEVVGEAQGLRTEVSELSERTDFAERLLAKQRDAERLAPPGSR